MTTPMKVQFKRQPMSELTSSKPAAFFVYRGDYSPKTANTPNDDIGLSRAWIFVSADEVDQGGYEIEIDRFFDSPASTVDWLAHMREKDWFDANEFCDMLHRFRAVTDSYGVI
jgi:hypothetical protein